MNHDGYAGDFPSRTKPTPNNRGAALLVTLHGWLAVHLSVLGWSATRGLGWEGRAVVQPTHVGGSSFIPSQELPVLLLLQEQAGSWMGVA